MLHYVIDTFKSAFDSDRLFLTLYQCPSSATVFSTAIVFYPIEVRNTSYVTCIPSVLDRKHANNRIFLALRKTKEKTRCIE